MDRMKKAAFFAGLSLFARVTSPALAAYESEDDPYVESTGAQYVNTGYVMKPSTKLVVDFQALEVNIAGRYFFGAGGDDASHTSFRLWINGNLNLEPYFGKWCTNLGGKALDGRRIVEFDVPARTVKLFEADGKTLVATKSGGDTDWHGDPDCPLVLFSCSTNAAGLVSGNYGFCRIFSMQAYEGGALVHDWKPVVKGGEAGLLDSATGAFAGKSNFGGAELVSGGDIPVVEDDPYIESDGTSFVNSGVCPGPDFRAEVDFALTALPQSNARICGCEQGGSYVQLYINMLGTTFSGIAASGWNHQRSLATLDSRRHTYIADIAENKVSLVSGAMTNTWDAVVDPAKRIAVQGTAPLGLFSRVESTSTGTRDWAGGRAKCRIYGARFYKGGVLVKNLVPCVKGGFAGFRDMVGGTFHMGEFNTSGLTASANVPRVPDDGYIELTGNDQTNADASMIGGHYIDTGYTPGVNTRIEFDYAFGASRPGGVAGDWYAIACGSSTELIGLCQNANSLLVSLGTNRWVNTGCEPQTNSVGVRRTVVFDAKNNAMSLTTAGFVNFTVAKSGVRWVTGAQSTPLKIGSTGSSGGGYTPVRVYGLKIFEDGSLVREYVPFVTNGAPGLKCGDTFVPVKWNATYGKACMPRGGGEVAVSSERDYDAYALFSGAQSVDTGYRATGKSEFVVDFSFANGYNKPQQFVLETGASAADGIVGRIYTSGSGGTGAGYSWSYSKSGNWTSTGVSVDHQRRFFTIDAAGDRVSMTPGDYNGDSTMAGCDNAYVCATTTKIGSSAGGGSNLARMRLYRFTIYEDGEKVREYVPCVIDGVPCLYDCVGKVTVTAAGLSVAGRGYDGAELWIQRPVGAVHVMQRHRGGGEAEVSVCAVGAKSYRWLMNGEPIDGGEDGNLTVLWQKAWQVDVYTVIPQYEVFGEASEGAPLEISVQSIPSATYLFVR